MYVQLTYIVIFNIFFSVNISLSIVRKKPPIRFQSYDLARKEQCQINNLATIYVQ
jgi:hypothetical protein